MLFSFKILSFCLMCKSPILFVRVYLILTDYGENRVIFEWILMKFCVGLKMEVIQVSSQLWIPLSTDVCCLCVLSCWQYVSDNHFWVLTRVIQFSSQLSLLQETAM